MLLHFMVLHLASILSMFSNVVNITAENNHHQQQINKLPFLCINWLNNIMRPIFHLSYTALASYIAVVPHLHFQVKLLQSLSE